MFISKATEVFLRQLKALGDPQRLRIMALCRGGELAVGELASVLGQSQPRVSQHLRLLCDAGLLNRFRDGKRVFYRFTDSPTPEQRRLLSLIPTNEPAFDADLDRVRALRGGQVADANVDDSAQRAIARALIDLTLASPLGDLLDVGCGRGSVLKLLASRAKSAVGVDVDSEARNIARIELFLAGVANCSLRQGDMYRLEFADRAFDTIILDDVLGDADHPERVLDEARRVLRPTGRLLVLEHLDDAASGDSASSLAALSRDRGLRMAPPRRLPARNPEWLLSVLTPAERRENPITNGAAVA